MGRRPAYVRQGTAGLGPGGLQGLCGRELPAPQRIIGGIAYHQVKAACGEKGADLPQVPELEGEAVRQAVDSRGRRARASASAWISTPVTESCRCR